MNSFTIVCLMSVVVLAAARPDDEHYTNKYDTINLNEILSNRRLLVPYVNCALEQGKCSPEGKELKSHIREALENYCAKCTPAQRDGTRQVIGHLINNENEFWNQLSDKYDADRKYTKKYEAELRTVKAGSV